VFIAYAFFGLGVVGYLLGWFMWVKLYLRARRGLPNAKYWWSPRSPEGNRMFARWGQPAELLDIAPPHRAVDTTEPAGP